MGVYIKGMEMPTSCGDCKAFVCYRQWAGDRGDCFCGITKSDCKAGAQNADCPLIPVPPHGDLIDRDALGMNYLHIRDDGMKIYTQRAIDNAPTIIPASFENPTKNARYSQDNPAEEGE